MTRADGAPENERREHDTGPRARAEPVRLVLQDAPPHRDTREEVEGVLEVEKGVRVLERAVS